MPKYPDADICKREVERGRMCFVGPIFFFLKVFFGQRARQNRRQRGGHWQHLAEFIVNLIIFL